MRVAPTPMRSCVVCEKPISVKNTYSLTRIKKNQECTRCGPCYLQWKHTKRFDAMIAVLVEQVGQDIIDRMVNECQE